MNKIRGEAQSIRALLGGSKFAIDYFQREYRWETKQVSELINDLTEKFIGSYDSEDDRSAVENYGHYFLGSIIISIKEGHRYIIDGQQRLTTLTLILIHIYRQLDDTQQKAQLADLIFSMKFGQKSFNLEVEERAACMEALFNGTHFDENGQSESVTNLLHRYQDIEEIFPEELKGKALPYFADWLIENVHLVEITAYSDADAYKIFETMNDRGLSLTPTDMLKGYLLTNITEKAHRTEATRIWRKHIASIKSLSKEEDADSIKSWLRSQFAETIRERKRGAQPRDFDLIGTEFHRWVGSNEERLGLNKSADFFRFIQEDFAFYLPWYYRVRQAAEILTDGLETIHYNAKNNFTLQYTLLLAPLRKEDKENEILRKLRVVSTYIDILITRRIWNWRAIDYSTMQYSMFLVMREIRGLNTPDLAKLLYDRINTEQETFKSNDRFRLHGTNGRQIHRMLARMTDYVETQSGRPSRYREYVRRHGKNGYEVEHIWADHPDQHSDEFSHQSDFSEYRNRIGGLLLLPKSFNASFGDMRYESKREHYLKQNLLAQSLHENAYSRDPGFQHFLRESRLPFRAHEEFRKADLDARQDLYRLLAERIWNPGKLMEEAEA